MTLEDVLSTFSSWELKKLGNARAEASDELFVSGGSYQRNRSHGRENSRSKSRGKGTYKFKCCICFYENNLKKDCPKRNKHKSSFVKKDGA